MGHIEKRKDKVEDTTWEKHTTGIECTLSIVFVLHLCNSVIKIISLKDVFFMSLTNCELTGSFQVRCEHLACGSPV